MTLQETIKIIEVVASRQPSINMVVENDVFRLNACPNARYGAFAWLQGEHSTSVDNSLITFSFTLFYVDRLKADLSNQIEIHNVGEMVIDQVLKELDTLGIYVSDTYTFNTFNQRFMDECAGVYCNVSVSVPVGSLCSDGVADFNDDFNEDFMIF